MYQINESRDTQMSTVDISQVDKQLDLFFHELSYRESFNNHFYAYMKRLSIGSQDITVDLDKTDKVKHDKSHLFQEVFTTLTVNTNGDIENNDSADDIIFDDVYYNNELYVQAVALRLKDGGFLGSRNRFEYSNLAYFVADLTHELYFNADLSERGEKLIRALLGIISDYTVKYSMFVEDVELLNGATLVDLLDAKYAPTEAVIDDE